MFFLRSTARQVPFTKAETASALRSPRLHDRPAEVADLAVNGRDLEKIGIRGPEVGRTLRLLLESVINDPAANSRESLLDAARKRVESQSEEDGPQH